MFSPAFKWGNCFGDEILSCLNLSEMSAQSKKSPTGPTERTPKSEYLIALGTYSVVDGHKH